MIDLIKKIPLPMAGVMLSLAALGNLLVSYGIIFKTVFGLLSAIILLLLTLKILIFSKDVIEELNNPVIASVVPTYSMGIMLLSVYLKDVSFNLGFAFWVIGVIIHIGLIMFYTKKFILNFNIKKLFPSTFVVYVGIGVAGITAPAFKLTAIGQLFFWFAFISFIILLPVLIYRSFIIKEIPEGALPTLAIFAAPANLSLAAYLNSFNDKKIYMIGVLVIMGLILYLGVLIQLPKLLKSKFYPSFAAFTFPMVISAIALKTTNLTLNSMGKGIGFLKYIVKFQELVALLMVLYVLVKYLLFLFKTETIKINNTISQ